MGVQVNPRVFYPSDFSEFNHLLHLETQLLNQWIDEKHLTENLMESGFELECNLLDKALLPTSGNSRFVAAVGHAQLITEVAKSCLEINTDHYQLHDHALSQHETNLQNLVSLCGKHAMQQNKNLIYIGTLPNSQEEHYAASELTDEFRYHALNQSMRHLRDDDPVHIEIDGENDHLSVFADSIAMVGAISSFQIHLRVGISAAVRFYNTAQIIAAPMVALCANSPFILGHSLWEESRIPWFEQMLLGKNGLQHKQKYSRVFFGNAYLKKSIMELYFENLHGFVALIPYIFDSPLEKMRHLQLHNGTINRWNRPVLGFDEKNIPHFRIEHRAISAGPTIVDMCANSAFYLGIMQFIATQKIPLESLIHFNHIKNNFYLCARDGLRAELTWVDNKKINVADLLLTILLPIAYEGLRQLDISNDEIEYYFSIIEGRIRTSQTGSVWQRKSFEKNVSGITE
jgi:gamma-glutamyl:cysteine ligase YbdK (ATP-grasp superfamily)